MEEFLKATEVIDWKHPAVLAKARELSYGTRDPQEVAKRCFEWVRDNVQHSSDFRRNPVTCNASDVLREGTGYCYAKSHLLAALLRANGIPAGFCYQRLSIDETGPPYSLHGLNAVHLPDSGGIELIREATKTAWTRSSYHPSNSWHFALCFQMSSFFRKSWPIRCRSL